MGSVPRLDETSAVALSEGRFELGVRGTTVELIVHPPADGARAVNAGEVSSALADFPVDRPLMDRVFAAVNAAAATPVAVGIIELPASNTEPWGVKISPSKMAAYVVPNVLKGCPPEAAPGHPIVSEADIRARLAAMGVNRGLLDDALAGFGRAQPLESATRVAAGIPPEPGKNASLDYEFDPNPRPAPVELEDGSIDYRASLVHRYVQAGAILVRRTPPVPGKPGMNVLGAALPPRPVIDRSLTPLRGKETEIVGDTLVAVIGGRPVVRGNRVEVLPVYEVRGNVDFSVGNIDFIGDVLVGGDVESGFTVRAGGSVTVRGVVDRATIVADKDITVRGMSGDANSHMQAGHAITAHYLHNAVVTAGVLVRAQLEIVNCTVRAQRVETAPNGRIVGGTIAAVAEVDAGTIGSPRGVPTEITVERGAEGQPAVVRARKSIHPRVVLKVRNAGWSVDDDYPGSSLWEFEGAVSRLGPAATGPEVDPPA